MDRPESPDIGPGISRRRVLKRINLACFCGPLITWNLNGFNLPPICTSDSDCLPVTGPGSVCINMNPNCDAVENKGCAAPCPGGKVAPRPGMKVVHA